MGDIASSPKFVELEDSLHERAIAEVGFDDFGDSSYLEGLRVLSAAYDSEAKFNVYGRGAAEAKILETLKQRLRAERQWKVDPGVLDHGISRPIVIMGLVRTGSTALHYLMGQDPGMQSLEYWLACSPQPRPPHSSWETHPDFRRSVEELDAMYAADPSLKAIHFMQADLSEECRHLLEQSFTDDGFEVNATVPSYSAWYESTDMTPTYRRHLDLVKLIGSTDPERRWLLKYPVHVRHLSALLEVYPDACIVQTHRDPTTVLTSYCSLVANFRALHEDEIDRKDIAEKQLEIWAAGLEEAIEVRSTHEASQFYDLMFGDFMADPIGSVKSIYEYFGQDLSEDGERKLIEWQTANEQDKHGKHEYRGEDIGIADAQILDRFSTYLDYFDMKPERRS